MRTPDSSPKPSNSRFSHSSSMFHERLPMKRFFETLESVPVSSVLVFLATGVASASALRFLGAGVGAASSSSSESSSEESSLPESESLPDSESSEDCLTISMT